MPDKPSEDCLGKVLLEDKQLVENSDSANSSDHTDLALEATDTEEDTEEPSEFDQILIGIQERMSRVMARVNSSCTLINQLHRDLKAQLSIRMNTDEAKVDIEMASQEKMTENLCGSSPNN
ncbi:uncharacterized protein DMAD_05168 [Drosophila madeirensis]|uniref:Uncharacterized protein n=1 Tax=Drosophila madeirensis TaxID=30013 RepID=A0AAU9FLC0_DROMD